MKVLEQVAFLHKGLIKHLFLLAPLDGKACEFQNQLALKNDVFP